MWSRQELHLRFQAEGLASWPRRQDRLQTYGKQMAHASPMTIVAVVAAAVFCGCAHRPTQRTAETMLIEDVTIVDVRTGQPRSHQSVHIRGGRIDWVGPEGSPAVPPSDHRLSAAGKWLIPGLIDTHAHFAWDNLPSESLAAFKLYVPYGVTTVRDASTRANWPQSLQWKARAAAGDSSLPTLVVSGRVDGSRIKAAAATAGGLAERLIDGGVDQLKIRDDLSLEEIAAVVKVGGAARVPVWGHTYQHRGRVNDYTLDAIRLGVAGLTHLSAFAPVRGDLEPAAPAALNPDGSENEAFVHHFVVRWSAVDDAQMDSLISLMRERDVWLEPTLVIEDFALRPSPQAHIPEILRLPPPVIGEAQADAYRRGFDKMLAFVRRFSDRGGRVVTGSDGFHGMGEGLHRELELLVTAGLTPARALRAATYDAAQVVGRGGEAGEIAPGLAADLVILDANPLEDIRNTRRIHRVIVRGQLAPDPVTVNPR